MDWLKQLAGGASASNNSVAVAGDNNAPIQMVQHVTINVLAGDPKQMAHVAEMLRSIPQVQAQVNTVLLPSDATARDDADKQHDAQIDSLRDLIEQKPGIALGLFEKLYGSLAATASGRIRFRIRANIGICHHLLGDDVTAARYLREAYADAPNEPKAIANNVFGLTLAGDPQEAFRFASEQIKLNPDNEALAGYMMQSAAYIEEVSSPLELVPPALRSCPEVLLGHIHFLQKRATDAGWWKAAHEAVALYPENEALRYYAAEAALAEIAEDPAIRQANRISVVQQERLRAAATVLAARWQKALNSEAEKLRPDQGGVGHNLLTAYFLLRDIDAIRQFCTTALADARCPDVVVQHIGRISSITGDFASVKEVIRRGQDSPDILFMRFHLAASEHDWQAVAATTDEIIDRFAKHEQRWCRVLARVAVLKVGGAQITDQALRDLAPLAGESTRAHIVLAKTAREQGLRAISAEEYDRAYALITPESDYAGRLMVAEEAVRREDWDRVIDTLAGRVSLAEESDELQTLALGFANSTPPRTQGLEFFKALPSDIRGKPRFALLAGTLHYNFGDLDGAEQHFARAHAVDPHLLDAIIALAQTHLRAGNRSKACDLLAAVDTSKVVGSAGEKMHLAQLMAAYGRGSDGIRLGYSVLCANVNDPKVNLTYVGLVLGIDPGVIGNVETVGAGCWVQLESQHGDRFEAIVDDGSSDYRQHVFPQDHPLVAGALGRKVGDTFEVKRDIGPPVQWTVREITDKAVYAFRDSMANFEHRFPKQRGLSMVSMPAGDVSALLDQIKDQSQRQRKALDFYLEDHWPLAVLAPVLGLDVVTLSTRIRHADRPIIANNGQVKDLHGEIQKLKQGSYELVILDTYTAWVAACGGLLPLMQRIFPYLAVPRATIDDLQKILAEYDRSCRDAGMTLSWKDGQFFREEYTAEDMAAQAAAIQVRIDAVRAHCEVLPVVWHEPPSELAKQVMAVAESTHVLDAGYLASADGTLLLSEDMFYRQWAATVFPSIQHTWLQAVFKYATDVGAISRTEYAKAVLALAHSRHDYLSVDSFTLHLLFLGDHTESLREFSTVAKYIGGKNPDWPSHVDVTQTFLGLLWDNARSLDVRKMKATGIVLENLFRFAGKRWPDVFAVLWLHSVGSRWQPVLQAWRKGHFLPVRPVQHALEKLSCA